MKKEEIVDLIMEILKEQHLLEMSSDRKSVKKEIKAKLSQITNHLLYLKLYPDSVDVEHWKGEICAFIKTFSNITVKSSHKKLDSETYFEWLYTEKYDNGDSEYIMSLYEDIVDKEGYSEFECTTKLCDYLDNELKKFYKSLADLCANTKVVLKDKILILLNNWHNNKIKF